MWHVRWWKLDRCRLIDCIPIFLNLPDGNLSNKQVNETALSRATIIYKLNKGEWDDGDHWIAKNSVVVNITQKVWVDPPEEEQVAMILRSLPEQIITQVLVPPFHSTFPDAYQHLCNNSHEFVLSNFKGCVCIRAQ